MQAVPSSVVLNESIFYYKMLHYGWKNNCN